ncbi:MAG TPA: hypothetical protein PK542_05360 [Treponemataceae bacterium]|nr:hypothetical protein [Treponemataceae bacterium]
MNCPVRRASGKTREILEFPVTPSAVVGTSVAESVLRSPHRTVKFSTRPTEEATQISGYAERAACAARRMASSVGSTGMIAVRGEAGISGAYKSATAG